MVLPKAFSLAAFVGTLALGCATWNPLSRPRSDVGPVPSAEAALPPRTNSREPLIGRALMESARTGDIAALRSQLAVGAEVDARDAEGRSALHLAAATGSTDAARELLAAGADVNATDQNGDTPYYVAALARHAELAGLLLDAGADRVGTRAYGGTPLIAIAERGWVDVAAEILRRPNIPVDHVNNLGWTALIEAIVLGQGGPNHQEIVRLLLAAGANPNLPDKAGTSPLTLARERGHAEIARLLEVAGGR